MEISIGKQKYSNRTRHVKQNFVLKVSLLPLRMKMWIIRVFKMLGSGTVNQQSSFCTASQILNENRRSLTEFDMQNKTLCSVFIYHDHKPKYKLLKNLNVGL